MADRDEVIAYLLNEMPEAERAAFAERWFSEPELYERLRLAEAGLLDEYVRGTLSRKQRRQIEQFLLGSAAQLRKLEFAAALQAALPRPARFRVPWRSIAAAVLVAASGLSLWLGLENRKLQKSVARLETIARPQTGGTYTLALPADTLRGESRESSVRLEPGTRVLRLELELKPGDETSIYTVTVSKSNQMVWKEGPLHPEALGTEYLAAAWIPAAALAAGEYSVQLEAPGRPTAYYRFALVR